MYSMAMTQTMGNTKNLTVRQGEVTQILTQNGKVTGVKTYSGAVYHAKAVILTTGTYLKARCIYGDVSNETGPNGLQAANYLTQSLKDLGIEMRRFKTGTPARIDKNSIDFNKMEEQKTALLNEIDSIDQNLVQVMAQIDILNGEITDKESAIDKTKDDLAVAEANRDKQYERSEERRVERVFRAV